ncbi:glutamate racemase [Vibrio sp. TH_r3]|uniref:glutamate racemase n=1 Tax=Vibrio sp. TH_r3 TaxID=3082084 RepID=UPI00295519DB|nr:glutamate racemase [Vibrio sp. TH_r3]MDV7106378.1 glutamate racemase [Vibrio sp. TH_r3]
MLQQPTILIFDSGVGGLSVYQEVKKKLPNSNYIYVFDNQGYPYGELDHDVLISRVINLIRSVVQRHKIDIIVIACNTASTIVLPSLRQLFSIPIVGVVPAIKPASMIAQKSIGLIATPATISRKYTHQLIDKFSPNTQVLLLGTTELVHIAEAKLRGEFISVDLIRRILTPLIHKIDVAVLGCTHFPLLKTEISQVFGENVQLVDSGKAIATRVYSLLENKDDKERENTMVRGLAYSSATPCNEVALNKAFQVLNFTTIKTIQLQDV